MLLHCSNPQYNESNSIVKDWWGSIFCFYNFNTSLDTRKYARDEIIFENLILFNFMKKNIYKKNNDLDSNACVCIKLGRIGLSAWSKRKSSRSVSFIFWRTYDMFCSANNTLFTWPEDVLFRSEFSYHLWWIKSLGSSFRT
jgi:hypothetical protein